MSMHKADEGNNATKLIRERALLMDVSLQELIPQAEEGCVISQATLLEAFEEGKGAQKSEDLVYYFEEKLIESTSDPKFELGVLWNRALRKKDRGDFEGMKDGFHQVINFMQNNMEMEDWDFSLFELMEGFLFEE
jgi:hypothetical protein